MEKAEVILAHQVSILSQLRALREFVADTTPAHNPSFKRADVLRVLGGMERVFADEILRGFADDFPSLAYRVRALVRRAQSPR